MDKKTLIILGILVAGFAGLLGISLAQKNNRTPDYDITKIIAADEYSGGFEEMVNGDPKAPVLIVEYGDYQCTACAPLNPYINEVIEEYDGKVALAFRTMILDYHDNGTAAASAALAASRQGFWKEYKDLLFENQNDWYYSDSSQRQEQFEEYFTTVSDGKGDLEQFRADMGSDEVAKKISFDAKLAQRDNVEWTPYFLIDGELVSVRDKTTADFLEELREIIDKKLAQTE